MNSKPVLRKVLFERLLRRTVASVCCGGGHCVETEMVDQLLEVVWALLKSIYR